MDDEDAVQEVVRAAVAVEALVEAMLLELGSFDRGIDFIEPNTRSVG